MHANHLTSRLACEASVKVCVVIGKGCLRDLQVPCLPRPCSVPLESVFGRAAANMNLKTCRSELKMCLDICLASGVLPLRRCCHRPDCLPDGQRRGLSTNVNGRSYTTAPDGSDPRSSHGAKPRSLSLLDTFDGGRSGPRASSVSVLGQEARAKVRPHADIHPPNASGQCINGEVGANGSPVQRRPAIANPPRTNAAQPHYGSYDTGPRPRRARHAVVLPEMGTRHTGLALTRHHRRLGRPVCGREAGESLTAPRRGAFFASSAGERMSELAMARLGQASAIVAIFAIQIYLGR